MNENTCYTYFRITGDFDPDFVTDRIGLMPIQTHKKDDTRSDGTEYGFASWIYGRCDEYDIIVENQMHKTIAPLFDKIDILKQIKNEFDVNFVLEIVPTVYPDNTAPCLAPSLKVIDFCHATKTEIDIDLYVMEQE